MSFRIKTYGDDRTAVCSGPSYPMATKPGPAGGAYRALTISVSEFAEPYVALRDAQWLADELRNELAALGYACGAPVSADCTSETVGAAVQDAIKAAGTDDSSLIVHVLTHGEVSDETGKLYVVGSDGSPHGQADVEGDRGARSQEGGEGNGTETPRWSCSCSTFAEAGTAPPVRALARRNRRRLRPRLGDRRVRPARAGFQRLAYRRPRPCCAACGEGSWHRPERRVVCAPKVAQEIRAEVRTARAGRGRQPTPQVTGSPAGHFGGPAQPAVLQESRVPATARRPCRPRQTRPPSPRSPTASASRRPRACHRGPDTHGTSTPVTSGKRDTTDATDSRARPVVHTGRLGGGATGGLARRRGSEPEHWPTGPRLWPDPGSPRTPVAHRPPRSAQRARPSDTGWWTADNRTQPVGGHRRPRRRQVGPARSILVCAAHPICATRPGRYGARLVRLRRGIDQLTTKCGKSQQRDLANVAACMPGS